MKRSTDTLESARKRFLDWHQAHFMDLLCSGEAPWVERNNWYYGRSFNKPQSRASADNAKHWAG